MNPLDAIFESSNIMDQADQEEFFRPLGPEDDCDGNPEFAIICAFISKFGDKIDLKLNIEQLKKCIEEQETLDSFLIDIHVKLLKKLRRYFVRDQWEKALIKFAYEYSQEDGYEIETLGYLKSRPSTKMQLLRRLLDVQFECDLKFKASVNLIEADELNTKSAGRDVEGNTYWPCVDEFGNLRVYREEPLQHKSWTTICKNTEDLSKLIEHLDATKDNKVKGEPQLDPYNPYPDIYPEYFIKEDPVGNKVVTTTKKSSKKSSKKGKNKSQVKKSSPLPTIDEIVEPSNQIETKPVIGEQVPEMLSEPQDNRPRSTSPNGSIESHVKFTLENIVSKVVSSFDYIFRRNSPDVTEQEEVKLEKNTEKSSGQSRKRGVKREKPKTEELPRRSSSRIQQLQQKKVEEEATKRKFFNEIKSQPIPESETKESASTLCNERCSRRDKKDKQRWRGKKGKKKLSWDKDDSDLSSTSSLSESNDESFMEALNEVANDGNDDDEFACEDEETNNEPVIIKRARTARQTVELEETSDPNNSSIVEEDKPCGRCDKSNDPDWILLCDMCDDGYHTTCCVPPMMYVPDGDWFCPPCEQKMLAQKLREIYESVVELIANIERERQKRQKLRQPAPKKITIKSSTDEVIITEKRPRDILNELNEPLAVQALDDELASSSGEELPSSYKERSSRLPKKKKTKLKKRTKRTRYDSEEDESEYEFEKRYKKTHSRNISDSDSEDDYDEDDIDAEEDFSDSSSEDGEQLKTRKARAFVSYKFEEYDELIQSAICGDSDVEIRNRVERDDTETCNVGRGKDMATIEALAYQRENGLASGEPIQNKPAKQRRKGRKLNDLDAESEIDIATSDESFQASSGTEDIEDEDEDEATEVSTEDDSSIDEIVSMYRSKGKKSRITKKRKRYSEDSDSDFKPRTRRAVTQKVSYRESTDEEDPLVSNIEPEPMTRNPINELSQYCTESPYPANSLFTSFNMSPPRPQFYKEDEVRSLSSDLNE